MSEERHPLPPELLSQIKGTPSETTDDLDPEVIIREADAFLEEMGRKSSEADETLKALIDSCGLNVDRLRRLKVELQNLDGDLVRILKQQQRSNMAALKKYLPQSDIKVKSRPRRMRGGLRMV